MQKRLRVTANAHNRAHCPLRFPLAPAPAAASLTDAATGKPVPCQLDGDAVCWILDRLPAGQQREYLLSDAPARARRGVAVTQGQDRIDVSIGGAPLTTYLHGADRVRPFLNPLIGPTGVSVLRELFEPGDGSKDHDHIHHRGILVAHGDVNGVDNWSETPRHGWQRHLRTDAAVSGPVFGRIATRNDWVAQDGSHVLFETRVMTFWNVAGAARVLDFDITFEADTQDVVFGDTKEGGILSVRVATPLRADRTGALVNAVGGFSDKECWGKRAHWCDYSGPIEGGTVGLAVFDHTLNLRHPTYWHIRNYGLFAANPFGLSHYYNDKTRNGAHTLPKGGRLTFRYRVFVHKGDSVAGKVGDAYHNFANPPEVMEVA